MPHAGGVCSPPIPTAQTQARAGPRPVASAVSSPYNPPVIRNIIFDWSGTLVDDLPAVWQATNHVLRQAGVAEMSLEQFRAEFSLPFRKFYDRFTPDVPLKQLEAWFHGCFREVQASVVELPHAREFLEFCRAQQVRAFVLSTVKHEHFVTQTARNRFHEYFERAYLEIWDKREKIRDLLKDHGLRPQETLFIGDMEHDIETARHGGVYSCAVLTGYNSAAQLRASRPDLIVAHLGELREILTRHAMELPGPKAEGTARDRRPPVVTVGGLIYNPQGEVLLVRTPKWSNLWGIPGGKVEYGESGVEALRRELKEETNLDVEDVVFVLVQDCIESAEFYRAEHFVLLNYTCRCRDNAEVRLNEEAREYRWVSPGAAAALPLNTPTRVLLEAVAGGSPIQQPARAQPA
jgi:phosphoglycolate phosphatase-like HAD superfamily hydrolase/ADP-ribose pyrophosphatase YjhB (NUDIX family)